MDPYTQHLNDCLAALLGDLAPPECPCGWSINKDYRGAQSMQSMQKAWYRHMGEHLKQSLNQA